MPSQRTAAVKVRGVQVHGSRKDEAVAGQRAALNLAGVEVADVTRGQNARHARRVRAARLRRRDRRRSARRRPLKHGARVRFHQGTAEIIGRVAIIGPAAAGAAPAIAPGSRALHPAATRTAGGARPGGDRFIIRAYSPPLTIAGGRSSILRRRGRRSAPRRRWSARASSTPAGARTSLAIARMIEEAGRRAFPLAAFVSRAGIDPQEVDVRSAALTATKRVDRSGMCSSRAAPSTS